MRDSKLFPSYYATSTNLVRFNFETTISKREDMRLLGEYSREQPDYGPAQKTSISSSVTSVKERVLLFRMSMEITVDPYLPSFLLSKYFQ